MPVSLERYVRLRPFSYHVTARENLVTLRQTMRLEPAASLMRRAGRLDLLRWRRSGMVELPIDGRTVVLKDQIPLHEKNTALDGAWTFPDFVEYLNEHVFFWPGTSEGPVQSGARLQEHYQAAGPLVIRVATEAVLQANPLVVPLFCPFNSGAPRQQQGRRVRRGPRLFTEATDFPRRESEVVELAFRAAVALPGATQCWNGVAWALLADHDA